MLSIRDRLRGYAVMTLGHDEEREYLNKFIEYKVIFKTYASDSENLYLVVPFGEISYIKKLFKGQKEFEFKIGGLIKYPIKYKKRLGFVLGLILTVVLNFYFSLLVWDIQIEGNEKLSDNYIEGVLDEYGLRVGVFRDSVDVDELCQNILINDGNMGWLSVNFRGTSAFVDVMEYPDEQVREKTSSGPTNIIASRDGYILSLEVDEGTPAVKVGESVKRGDLLISGIVDSNAHGYLLKEASGKVFAEVYEEYTVEVPLKYTEKVYTGESFDKKTLVFFGNKIKVCENSGNVGENCDIIREVKALELFDKIKLPIELVSETYNVYEAKEFERTPDEARTIAYRMLEDKLSEISSSGEVIKKSVNGENTDNAYVIKLEIYKSCDIAKAQKIPIAK